MKNTKKLSKKLAVVIPDKRPSSPVVNIIDLDGDVVEQAVSLRDITDFLLLPIFSTSKKRDNHTYHWCSPDGNKSFSIIPSILGRATVWDADIIIYLVTTIYGMIKEGTFNPDKEGLGGVAMPLSHLLRFKGMSDSGRSYNELVAAHIRLSGTFLNFSTDRATTGVSLIQDFQIERDENGRATRLIISPSNWLYSLIINKHKILTMPTEYTTISSPLQRQIYRICRRMCGDKETFYISLEKLWIWCGKSGTIRAFRHFVKNHARVLEYTLTYLSTDSVLIINLKIFKARDKRYFRGFKNAPP